MALPMGLSKWRVLVVSLIIIYFILSLSYIINGHINGLIEVNREESFGAGGVAGYNQAVLDIARGVSTCQIFPLSVGNSTIDIVAYQCIQQPSG